MDPLLLDRWFGSLTRRDLDGLLSLYHPDAVLDAASEQLQGHDAIRRRLQRLAKKFGDMELQLVEAQSNGSRIAFDTVLAGRRGAWKVRHDLWLEDGRIVRHGVTPS